MCGDFGVDYISGLHDLGSLYCFHFPCRVGLWYQLRAKVMVEYLNIKLNARDNCYPLSNTLLLKYIFLYIFLTSSIQNYFTQIYISEIGFNYYSFLLTNQSDDITYTR